MRLLVAEVDSVLAESLRSRFQQENFSVRLIGHFEQLANVPENAPFDMIVLDTNLPVLAGEDPLRAVHRRWPDTPVILLSSESSVEERVRALNAGADDYLVKPFAMAELVARARAVIRRGNRPRHNVFTFEDLEVNRVSHEVWRAGRAIELSPKEYALLEFLLRDPGRPVARHAIVEEVWHMRGDTMTNVVDVYINYLRRKIDAGSEHPLIRTVRGIGYQIGGNHLDAARLDKGLTPETNSPRHSS